MSAVERKDAVCLIKENKNALKSLNICTLNPYINMKLCLRLHLKSVS